MSSEGVKNDQGKLRWTLLPIEPINEVIRVLMFGSETYDDDNWKKVPNAKERYYDAALRHITTWKQGNIYDGDECGDDKEKKMKDGEKSGFHHLAHAVCCLLFILWFELIGRD